MGPLRRFADWLDSRTGFRAGRSHLLDEPLPAGTGWWFVTGSILLFLLGVQLISGVVLTMYYVPSPEHAYDSVRYITDQLPLGRIVRGLHFFGASFIVIAAVIHMLRVVLFGSYKKPREVTWMTGVVLLLLILAFALTGYLLPWDQKAYWATTVTINIARSGPLRRAGRWRDARRRRSRRADTAALVRRARLPAAGGAHRLRRRAHLPDAAPRHLRSGEDGARRGPGRSIRITPSRTPLPWRWCSPCC